MGYVRRVRRNVILFIVCAIILIYLTATQFSLENSFSEQKVLKSLHFKNALTYLLAPLEIFDDTLVKNKGSLKMITSSLFRKVSSPEIKNTSWKLTDHFINSKLDPADDLNYITSYIDRRQYEHLYDPLITETVYLRHLNERYARGDDSIPFSWEDWVDMSPLNRFLGAGKLSCQDFFAGFNIKHTLNFDPSSPSSDYFDYTYCLSDSEYLATEEGSLRSADLLPGFNFAQRMDQKSDFLGKVYNAKSHLLSYAPPPNSIYFLSSNGSYFKALPFQSTSMMRNGMFDKFKISEPSLKFDPQSELENLDQEYRIYNENALSQRLSPKNGYKIDIPEENFIFNPSKQFSDLFTKSISGLTEQEKKFRNSLEYSLSYSTNLFDKYFKEVNLVWPASYNGHRLTENGGHYDAKFFSGFISEMPNMEITAHSPHFEGMDYKKQQIYSDSPEKRRTVILSNLMHTLFTATFHHGIIMFPAHGSLLGWYFTGSSFPWDIDGDVQMPIKDLAEFCLNFNNSMIVQNPQYGTTKLFVDCSSTLTHRGKGNGQNNIDARVIDVDSGLFVDVTGLAVSDDAMSKQSQTGLRGWISEGELASYPFFSRQKKPKADRSNGEEIEQYDINKRLKIYNCRNDHFYTYDMISPLRLSLFEGAPALVAAQKKSIRAQLEAEYGSKCFTKKEHETYVFSDKLRMWINADDIHRALSINNISSAQARRKTPALKRNIRGVSVLWSFRANEALATAELLKTSLYDITQEESLSKKDYKKPRLNILEEVYHDRVLTSVHEKEMAIFNSNWEWFSNIDDYVDIPTGWKELAEWMLSDHAPRKISYYDYLIFSEMEDTGKQIRVN